MIVLQSTFDSMHRRATRAEDAYYAMQKKWNKLVKRINKLGGETFLKQATIKPVVPQFSADELTRLIMLCHPDKHDGKPMANEMTQRLLALKNS